MMRSSNAFRRRESLAGHTTFRIGGPAAFWYEPVLSELEAVYAIADRAGLPVLVLGSGSNCLVSDEGFDGLAIRLSDISTPTTDHRDGETVIVSAAADTPWDEFVSWCCASHYQGTECMAGIPGTVGGAVFGAIGAYGQQVADIIEWVDDINPRTGMRRRRNRSDIAFGYRSSDYHRTPDVIITTVGFRLTANGCARRTHPDTERITPHTAGLPEFSAAVRRIRERKGAMLWIPGHGHLHSAGSFFKNPVVDVGTADTVIGTLGGNGWYWPTEGAIKLSAARLIEAAGFTKGYTRGGASISPFHTLCLVNPGRARASDVIGLAREIRDRVAERFSVSLEPEVRMVGFNSPPLA